MPTISTCRKHIFFKFPQKKNITNLFGYFSIRDKRPSLFTFYSNERTLDRFVSSISRFSYNQNKWKRKSKYPYNLNSFSSNSLVNGFIDQPPFKSFKDLSKISPYFLLNGEQIRPLQEPQEFYEELKVNRNYLSNKLP